METKELSTLELIHIVAMNEFREKGFKSASLRNIVKEAGVTTGAFYGYYKSKEQLFDALVGEQYHTFMERYRHTQLAFTQFTPDEQRKNMGKTSGECMLWMMEYVYEHKDVFKLILCNSEGTKYEHMIHELVEVEVEATHAFAKVLKDAGKTVHEAEPQLEHMLISGMFSAFFEMIIHDVPYEKAPEYVQELRAFYTAGWGKIMGI